MIPLNTSVVSGVALSEIEGETKILMMKRVNGGFWCHVAGKIEGEEAGWQAIIREFYEETQIQVTTLYGAAFLEQFYEADNDRIMVIPAFAVMCSANQKVTLNFEHTEYKWCSLAEAKDIATFPNQKLLYDHVWQFFVLNKPSKLMEIDIS